MGLFGDLLKGFLSSSDNADEYDEPETIQYTKDEFKKKVEDIDKMLADPNSKLSEAQKKAIRKARESMLRQIK